MNRVYNFSAGPSILPESVLAKAAEEMLNYNGTGMSVMEMSHRSKAYTSIIENAESLLRKLMKIDDSYSILFVQGGASTQFSMIPMNLFSKYKKADFINTGNWSKKAISEAKLFGAANVAASSEDSNFTYIPEEYNLSQEVDYVHITSNNTLEGTRFVTFPDTGNVPLVADMSSEIMSREMDVNKFGLIYAGAQKNLGPAGLTIVIVKTDLIGKHLENTPTMLRYETHAKEKSLYNTPPCYSIYVAGLVFKWLDDMGGVKTIEKINNEKAAILYNFLDESKMFLNKVNRKDRSLMNVPFTAPTDELNEKFIKEAEQAGLCTLRGHRLIGGMRASIYNAMPVEGVIKLVDFMKKFELENK
ncbi:phosphoserine aminotransferase [Ruminiclostridium hungatei]|uniref:Phosphoserine aminotransferase n=1 Tax=Ruminiclostridium hungatei TaxID=48256 RepID=A0A1V4SHM0_RUMHU|nr:3-phosphoserine/phosphohydroxythreonine transaminase [Ruminiclostridium hungatei]OPX42731.1 phosphoserine aminotransferase [Ruminiclostridium hungatei]